MAMWTLDEGLKLVRLLQPEAKGFGYHLTLGGGVLNNGQSDKDLDLYFHPMANSLYPKKEEGLLEWLRGMWGSGDQIGNYSHDIEAGAPVYNVVSGRRVQRPSPPPFPPSYVMAPPPSDPTPPADPLPSVWDRLFRGASRGGGRVERPSTPAPQVVATTARTNVFNPTPAQEAFYSGSSWDLPPASPPSPTGRTSTRREVIPDMNWIDVSERPIPEPENTPGEAPQEAPPTRESQMVVPPTAEWVVSRPITAYEDLQRMIAEYAWQPSPEEVRTTIRVGGSNPHVAEPEPQPEIYRHKLKFFRGTGESRDRIDVFIL